MNRVVQLVTCSSPPAGPPAPEDVGEEGVGLSAPPVYSELWFILLLALLGLFLLALLLGLVLQRYPTDTQRVKDAHKSDRISFLALRCTRT